MIIEILTACVQIDSFSNDINEALYYDNCAYKMYEPLSYTDNA